MKQILSTLLLFGSFLVHAQDTVTVFPRTTFYDMYADLVNEPTPAGVIRMKNTTSFKKIDAEILDKLTSSLMIDVNCNALCDNYDRIGRISLVIAKKNASIEEVQKGEKIEIGRFITPFMYLGRDPKYVHYSYSVDYLTAILTNNKYRLTHDFWLELSIFAVPYAAQKEVKGCDGRNDTYQGEVNFIINATSNKPMKNTMVEPIAYSFHINNYDSLATDSISKTTKTFRFHLDKTIKNATLMVISSNHGANDGGEEYVRRKHFLYVDNKQVLEYTPGGLSCEPYRKLNTQPNGIYENKPMSDSAWASWNNWCPGSAIPVRKVQFSVLKKGCHSVRISVPDAQFVDKQGYFPISLYVIGKSKAKID